MSTEPTPENLRRIADGLVVSYHVVPSMSSPAVDVMRAAADLIEAQQARILRLERILCTYAVMTRTQGLGLSDADTELLLSLAASPDTPETRP